MTKLKHTANALHSNYREVINVGYMWTNLPHYWLLDRNLQKWNNNDM